MEKMKNVKKITENPERKPMKTYRETHTKIRYEENK